jgi:MFS family permease
VEASPTLGRAAALHALRSRDFRLLFAGQSLSLIGDFAYVAALAWTANRLEGPRALALILAANAVCMLATLLVGGALADRYDRRKLMIVSDLARGATVAVLAVAAGTGNLGLPLLIVLSGIVGLADGFFMPAFGGIVPLVVDAPLLPSANALIGFARWGGVIVGSALAGLLLSVTGPGTVFALDAASFAVSAALVALAHPRRAERAESLGTFHEIADGVRYVAGIPWLWVTIVCASFSVMVAVAPYQSLLPAVVRDHFDAGPAAYGALTLCSGAGTAAGALLYGQRRSSGRRVVVTYSFWGIANLLCAITVLVPSLAVAAGLSVVRGVLIGFALAIWETTLMELVPTERLGRVISLDYFGSFGLMPIGFMLAAAVEPLASAQVLIAVGQVLSGSLLLLALLSRRLREI